MANLKGSATVLLCVCVALTEAGQCVEKAPAESSMDPLLALRRELFCNYDTSVNPTKAPSNTTDVTMYLRIMNAFFEEERNTMTINAATSWEWQDERLKWNASNHGEIEGFILPSKDIWVPHPSIHGSVSRKPQESHVNRLSAYCYLGNTGHIECFVPTKLSAHCITHLARWPFDTNSCSFQIDYWDTNMNHLNLVTRGNWVVGPRYFNRDLKSLRSSGVLHKVENEEILNVTVTWFSYECSLVFKRHYGGRVAAVVVPALVLAALTLCTFCFEPYAPERLLLTSLDIMCHCLYLRHLDSYLPSNGDQQPLILTFYRDSLLMAGMSLVITLVVRRMTVAKCEPPSWISFILNGVLSSHIGQIFLLGGADVKTNDADDADVDAEIDSSSKGSKRWQLFAVFVDRASFLVYLLTFVILLVAFI